MAIEGKEPVVVHGVLSSASSKVDEASRGVLPLNQSEAKWALKSSAISAGRVTGLLLWVKQGLTDVLRCHLTGPKALRLPEEQGRNVSYTLLVGYMDLPFYILLEAFGLFKVSLGVLFGFSEQHPLSPLEIDYLLCYRRGFPLLV